MYLYIYIYISMHVEYAYGSIRHTHIYIFLYIYNTRMGTSVYILYYKARGSITAGGGAVYFHRVHYIIMLESTTATLIA